MNILLKNISKRFGNQWIFRNINYEFRQASKYAITGYNGSGKSTLLKIIISKIPFTKGAIEFKDKNENSISFSDVYQYISIATTSMSLIEEFTLEEHIKLHFKFRNYLSPEIKTQIFHILDLEKERKKLISNFSSGMKQRLKLGLAILSESQVLILDEPGSNLDENAKNWFQNLLKEYIKDRTLIIASNDPEDYQICDINLRLEEFI